MQLQKVLAVLASIAGIFVLATPVPDAALDALSKDCRLEPGGQICI
ncbi:hypothetical protein MD484_g7585, partial [Candolleomyces efflorescens]